MRTDLPRFETHEVLNQPEPPHDYNAWATDLPLREAVEREGGGWAAAELSALGALAGGEMIGLGFAANENRPKFRPYDRAGRRIDQVEYHPAYHRLMEIGIAHGVSNFNWRHPGRPGANVARAALMYLYTQAEQGTTCPLTMTYASVPVLLQHAHVAAEWLPLVNAQQYDPRPLPKTHKPGVTIGMGMTEKQGGSDVRANTTRAEPLGREGPGEWYALVGHKWFFSAPMSDAFLVLAQAAGGLSCFLLPRFSPDGTLNAIRLQRLKDKLGDWSNAGSEVEFHNARAQLIGDEGRGVATILEMVALTRQDCMIGSAGQMRQALVQALHHARHRKAFGKLLVDQPLMKNVLADLALESEAALLLTLRVARAVGSATHGSGEAAFARIATAIGKFWICKRCVPFVNEAQECLGGMGYVEESVLARLYRQAPLNGIWEGSGNIQCLDVLRALGKEPATREALRREFEGLAGESALLDATLQSIDRALDAPGELEPNARAVVERMAIALAAAQFFRAGRGEVGRAFLEARLGAERGTLFGASKLSCDIDALIGRVFPE